MGPKSLVGIIPENWSVSTLGEVAVHSGGNVQTGPFGSQLHAAAYVDSGIPSIMPKNIKDNRIEVGDIARVTEADATRLHRHRVRPGDIIYSRRGDVEKRALVREAENGWLCGTGCLRIRFGDNSVIPTYAAFYLGHPDVRAWIVRHAHGATMPNLNTSLLSALPFVVPPLPEQRAIANVLGALDDKIELNRQMNQTLDEIARTLFTSWFVNFDPVRAKAEGRQPDGMDADTGVLFPDRLVDSELGPIPAGWEVTAIGDVVRVVGGSTPSTKEPLFWDNGTNLWITPKDLSGLASPVLIDAARRITDAGVNQISSRLLPSGTVLLSSRAPVGYLAVTTEPTAINQGFIGMVCDGKVSSYYILNWARKNVETIKSNAGGTTFAEISKRAFRPIKVIVPSRAALSSYEEKVGPLYKSMETNLSESRTLFELRDTLLPELLSGRLRVGAAESVFA